MNSSNIIFYSKNLNNECSNKQNEYFTKDFSGDNPREALKKDFDRNTYFLDKKHLTRNKTEAERVKIIEDFVTRSKPTTISAEQQALCKLLMARGGQALSRNMNEQVMKLQSSKKPDHLFLPGECLELAWYTHGKNSNSLERHTIHLYYQVSVNNIPMQLNPDTRELELISDSSEMLNNIRALQRDLLTQDEFKYLQLKITENTDKLILAKLMEEMIRLAFGYRAIAFAFETTTLTSTNGKVRIQQDEFAMGVNTTELKINPTLVEENYLSLSDKNAEDNNYRCRNAEYTINGCKTMMSNLDSKKTYKPEISPLKTYHPVLFKPEEKHFYDSFIEFLQTVKKMFREIMAFARLKKDEQPEVSMRLGY